MQPNPDYLPVISLNWSADDLAIDIATHGYSIKPAAHLEALGEPVDWVIDHQDRVVFIDADLDYQAFTRAVNAAYDDVRRHEPKALPSDRQAPTPDLSPWAVPATPEPGPDDWIEQRYELHRVAYERFIDATRGYDRNTARLAALLWFCNLTPAEQSTLAEAKTADAIAYVGPAGWFVGRDHRHIHVAIPPAVRRAMDESNARARAAHPNSMIAGSQFAPAFFGFGLLDPDAIAGAMIDAAMLMDEGGARCG